MYTHTYIYIYIYIHTDVERDIQCHGMAWQEMARRGLTMILVVDALLLGAWWGPQLIYIYIDR